jgi:uncharacterized protein (DUF1810 family)
LEVAKLRSFDLGRFIKAQNDKYEGYDSALSEIRQGRKQGHWIWYVFPQLKNLGRSSTAQFYGINGIAEAQVYLDEPVLRERLLEISQTLFEIEETNPVKVLGHTDSMKVKSSMTLFTAADPTIEIFRKVLEKFYQGKLDALTTDILEKE